MTGKPMTHDQRLRAKGLRRVGWQLPIDLVERIDDEASVRMVSTGKLVELVMTRWLDENGYKAPDVGSTS